VVARQRGSVAARKWRRKRDDIGIRRGINNGGITKISNDGSGVCGM